MANRWVAAVVWLVAVAALAAAWLMLPPRTVLAAGLVVLIVALVVLVGWYLRLLSRERAFEPHALPKANWPSLNTLMASGDLSPQDKINYERVAEQTHSTVDRAVADTFDTLVNGSVSTWVIPLSDFVRMHGAKPDNSFAGRFVVMFPVAYDTRLTDPVRPEGQDPGFFFGRVMPPFVTDFASIPGPVQILAGPPAGSYSRAAIVHDWAYSHYKVELRGHSWRTDRELRRQCDHAMLELMRQDETAPARRALIYLGVRLGGRRAFRDAPTERRELRSKTDPMLATHLIPTRTAMYRHLFDYREVQVLAHPELIPSSNAVDRGDLDQALNLLGPLAQGPGVAPEVARIAGRWLRELQQLGPGSDGA